MGEAGAERNKRMVSFPRSPQLPSLTEWGDLFGGTEFRECMGLDISLRERDQKRTGAARVFPAGKTRSEERFAGARGE